MLVYRDDERTCDAGSALAAVMAAAEAAAVRPRHDSAVDLLIELGEFEAAVADRLFPDGDGLDDLERRLRAAALAAGHAVIAACEADSTGRG